MLMLCGAAGGEDCLLVKPKLDFSEVSLGSAVPERESPARLPDSAMHLQGFACFALARQKNGTKARVVEVSQR